MLVEQAKEIKRRVKEVGIESLDGQEFKTFCEMHQDLFIREVQVAGPDGLIRTGRQFIDLPRDEATAILRKAKVIS